MTPIPTELITLFGSSVLGGVMRMWSSAIQVRRQERLLPLQYLHAQSGMNIPKSSPSLGFQWTRRIIALTAVFFIIAFPKLISVFYPNVAVHIGYPEISKGFLCFTSSVEVIRWVSMKGLVISPLDTHLLSAIVGLYFGGSLTYSRSY